MLHTLAFDPGKTTGCAYLKTDQGMGALLFTRGERDFISLCDGLMNQIQYWRDRNRDGHETVVVAESFIITAATARNSQAPWSLETIGVLRYFAHLINAPFILQQPSSVKRLVTDKVLQKGGFYTKTQPHARDATRHAVYYLLTKRDKLKEIL